MSGVETSAAISLPLPLSYALRSPFWTELLDLIRTVAIVFGAVLIPLSIWWDGRRRQAATERDARDRERRRATLELIWTIASSPTLMERQSRFYRYRRFRLKADGAINPYEQTGVNAFIHDCIVILNTYDAACVEILRGTVDEDMIYEASRDAIIGTKTVFDALTLVLEQDLSDNFPYLKDISLRWQQKALKDKIAPVLRIPSEKS